MYVLWGRQNLGVFGGIIARFNGGRFDLPFFDLVPYSVCLGKWREG